MRVGVLALQGDVREHVAALRALGVEPVPVRRPSDLDGLAGIVVPGGESTAIGLLLVAAGLLEPLRAALAAGLPAYGSCAGMVLLADRVLDGRPDQVLLGGMNVTVRRNAFGRQIDSFETDVDIDGEPIHAVFIRAPWVEQAGAEVEILGRVPAVGVPEPAAGRPVLIRQGRLLASAFHPELTGDLTVHRLFVASLSGPSGSEDQACRPAGSGSVPA